MWVSVGAEYLLPMIVLVEAVIIWIMLRGGVLLALWHSTVMNIASALVGWLLQFVTMFVAGKWLFDTWSQTPDHYRQNRVALLIAFGVAASLFLVSWAIEALVLRKLRPSVDSRRIVATSAIANLTTYVGLFALNGWVLWPYWN